MKIVSSSSAAVVFFTAVLGSVNAGSNDNSKLQSPAEAYSVATSPNMIASDQVLSPQSEGFGVDSNNKEGFFFPGIFGGPFQASEARKRLHEINAAKSLNKADSLRFAKKNKEFDNVDFAKKIAFSKQNANENAKSIAKDDALSKKNVFNKVAAESNNNAAAGFLRRRLDILENDVQDLDTNEVDDGGNFESSHVEGLSVMHTVDDNNQFYDERRLSTQGQSISCGNNGQGEGCGGNEFGFGGFGFGPFQDSRSANRFKQISNAKQVDAANRLRFNAVNRNAENVDFAKKLAFAKQHARDNAISAKKDHVLSKKRIFNARAAESKNRCVTGVC